MKRTLLMVAMIFALAAIAVGQNAPSYDIDLRIAPDKGTIDGEMTVKIASYLVKNGKLWLSLALNYGSEQNPKLFPLLQEGGPDGFSPAMAEVSELTINGKAQATKYASPPSPVYQNFGASKSLVEIDVSGEKPDADGNYLVRFNYSCRLPHMNALDDAYFEDRFVSRFSWFPYIVDSADLTKYRLRPFSYSARVAIDKNWQMARMGASFEKAKDGTISIQSAGPASSFALCLFKGYKTWSVPFNNGTKTLDIMYRPTGEQSMMLVSAFARDALDYYAIRYFPLETKYVSVIENGPGGICMAADSIVLLPQGITEAMDWTLPGTMSRQLDYVVAHELGHQYWGIGMPPDFMSENYLSEGLNEYSTLEYYEGKYGRWDNLFAPTNDIILRALEVSASLAQGRSMRGLWANKVYANRAAGFDSPLSAPAALKIQNGSVVMDYGKAPFVFAMLGNYLGEGEASFREALTAFAREYRYREIDTENLRLFLEARTGKDLKAFFDAFIYGTKRVDYAISGALNQKVDARYKSVISVKDLGDSGLFVPTTITLFLSGGGELSVRADKAGDYEIETDAFVTIAYVDIDLNSIDVDRKNNFFPKSLQVLGDPDERKTLTDVDTWGLLLGPTYTNDFASLGLIAGLSYSDNLNYGIKLFVAGLVPISSIAKGQIPFTWSMNAQAWYELPLNSRIGFSGMLEFPGTLKSATFSFSLPLYTQVDNGYVGIYLFDILDLGFQAGLVDINLAIPGSGKFLFDASLKLNALQMTGSAASLSNRLLVGLGSGSIEDMVSLSLDQGIAIFQRTLLGIELSGNASFGSIDSLRAKNLALGIDYAGSALFAYGARARLYFAFPLFNNIDKVLFNFGALQSLNLAFCYEIGSAFNQASELLPNSHQAFGLLLLPSFRIQGDAKVSFAAGLSFDLTKIMSDPGNQASWNPVFSIDLSSMPALFSESASY